LISAYVFGFYDLVEKTDKIISYVVFLSTLTIVLLNLVAFVFPALIISIASTYESNLDPFEIGPLATSIVITSAVLIGIGFAYYKKKLPSSIDKPIKYILNFEISRKIAIILGILLLTLYIGFSVDELTLDEAEQWPDFKILQDALEIWPSGESDSIYVKEQNDRYVRMFLLSTSQDVFQNIKLLPFVASIILVIVTYFFTYQISHKRFSGIVAMAILLQSYTFLKFDTIAVYENIWVLFYVLSLYAIYKKWYLSSPVWYLLSVFTKAFAAPYLLMSIFFIARAKINNKQKIVTISSYGVAIIIMVIIFFVGDSIYSDLVRVDWSEFWIGFTAFSYQMRFDLLMVLTILPLTVGLFLTSRRGVKEADSILILFLGTLLAGPVLSLLTDFYFILPYRFVPLIVFFSIGIGVLLSKKSVN